MYISGVKATVFSRKTATEKDLIQAAGRGDSEAITWLYREFGPVLFSVCRRYSDSQESAEDLFQEGFLKILDKLGSFRGESGIKTWMYRVMCNYCINELRRPLNKIKWADVDELEYQAEAVAEPDDLISVDALMALIQLLPTGYRLVLNMYAIEDKSHAEIAELLGISEVSSRTQLFKARRMLKKLMEEKGYAA
ncbi:MAG: RNA polymerase sigma factor [Bacteroidia bacterium]|jgi:RNA polymerase sigma-70 factor (ECF subfamily)